MKEWAFCFHKLEEWLKWHMIWRLNWQRTLGHPALASQVHRDYKNVHTDVKALLHVGLIEENEEGLLSVPRDVIVSELPLLAKAT
jgi:hypothetical protein